MEQRIMQPIASEQEVRRLAKFERDLAVDRATALAEGNRAERRAAARALRKESQRKPKARA